MKLLSFAYYCVWLSSILIQILVMTGILPIQGILATNPQAQYVCSLISVIITLIFIYLGLKMLTLPNITDAIQRGGFPVYFKYAQLRTCMAQAVTCVDLLFYHFTLQSSCGLCWLITMFALFFIKPGNKEFERLTT